MDQTTLRRARWWALGLAVLLAVGVGLTVARNENPGKADPSTSTTLVELQDEVRQATRPEVDGSVP